jgi:ABC-type dipeptide/oligopeptide/nickel transport system permease component
MRIYGFLFQRLATGIVMILGFTLLCFAIFSSVPPVQFLSIFPTITPPRQEISPWVLQNYTWWDFWMDGRMDTQFQEIGRFVFYVWKMYRGEYGWSWEGVRSISFNIGAGTISSVLLVVIGLLIAIWLLAWRKVWRLIIGRYQNRDRHWKCWIGICVIVLLVVVTGTLLVHFVAFNWPGIYNYLLRGSRIPYSAEEKDLLDPRFFVMPAFAMAGAIITGWKLSSRLNVHKPIHLLAKKPANLSEVKLVVPQIGLQLGFFYAFLITSVVFIESLFPYWGIGRLFRNSLYADDFPVMNAMFFLSGITVIGISFSVEVVYGLLRFGPYRFNQVLLWRKQLSQLFNRKMGIDSDKEGCFSGGVCKAVQASLVLARRGLLRGETRSFQPEHAYCGDHRGCCRDWLVHGARWHRL